jgi:hypothetical protein
LVKGRARRRAVSKNEAYGIPWTLTGEGAWA